LPHLLELQAGIAGDLDTVWHGAAATSLVDIVIAFAFFGGSGRPTALAALRTHQLYGWPPQLRLALGVAGVAGVPCFVLGASFSLAARRKPPAVVMSLGAAGAASAWVATSASARDRVVRVLRMSNVLVCKPDSLLKARSSVPMRR